MNLETTYMKLKLRNPLVASASPLQRSIDNIRSMEDAGMGAVVMFSLFEEQIRHEQAAIDDFMDFAGEAYAESLSYFPRVCDYHTGVDQYLELLRQAVDAVDIPVIGSLNGVTHEGWVDYAKDMQQAGAAGIELNVFYIPAGIDEDGRDVEQRYINVLSSVRNSVDIPVAVKLSPFFSSIGNMCQRLDDEGVDGLVLFNRFYQPDFDIENLEVISQLQLSQSMEIRLPLLWIAVLYGKLNTSLAATRGVTSHDEIIKYIMAGADAVMVTSALLRHGIPYARQMLRELESWMEERDYRSVAQMKGSMSQKNVADPHAFERANYIKLLNSWKPSDIPV